MVSKQEETLTNLKTLIDETFEAAKQYEHSYGQAREEALADYGNKFSRMWGAITQVAKLANPIAPPEEYAQYYHAALVRGLKPHTFEEYQKECARR